MGNPQVEMDSGGDGHRSRRRHRRRAGVPAGSIAASRLPQGELVVLATAAAGGGAHDELMLE
ncbi:MAG: hypothetical protein U0168_19525 [Nannocystaceae bacterium]